MFRVRSARRASHATKALLAGIPMLALSLSTACNKDDSIAAPNRPVAQTPASTPSTNVSPFAVSAAYSTGDGRIIDDNGSAIPGSYVYFALPTGVYAGALRATVQLPNGTSVTYAATDGAIDPIAIPAAAGDALFATLYLDSGDSFEFNIVVPQSSQPRIVRVSPPANMNGVSLTASMQIVFSEPIAASSLSASAVQLLDGVSDDAAPVAGQLAFGDSAHLTLTFAPYDQLSAATTYVLRVGSDLRGDNGQSLASGMASEFTTTELTEVSAPTTLKLNRAATKTRTGRGR